MPPRYSPRDLSYSFGPGPLTPAVKWLVIANVVAFLLSRVVPMIALDLGLIPRQVVEQFAIWQLVTYMFLHAGVSHILFNMLSLWMFGVELERRWGSRFFTRYYFICGIGAGVSQILAGLIPAGPFSSLYVAQTIGASGAIYGVLLAYALSFPNRPILIYFIFPVPAKILVAIMGGISLISAMEGGGGVAHVAHLGGLVVGYVYLKTGGANPLASIKYEYLKWKTRRRLRRFDVYDGGKVRDINRRIH